MGAPSAFLGAALSAPRPLHPRERRRVVDWLDQGLRAGERGRLEAEYPLSIGAGGTHGHRVVFAGEAPVAHAMLHPVEAWARGRTLGLGLVGSVYTDPAFRGRGLASACIRSCVDDARRRGLPLVALWSDLHSFYAGLGFRPAGRETFWSVDRDLADRAAGPLAGAYAVAPPARCELAALEALYASKPARAVRPPGALAKLAATPDLELVVAHREGRPRAYAALGRGDDFAGVVHEWAGEPEGVLACVAHLCGRRPLLGLLSGPVEERLIRLLRAAGARGRVGCFALVKLLDAGRLWRAMAPGCGPVRFAQDPLGVRLSEAGREFRLQPEEALELFFSGRLPAPLASCLGAEARGVLESVLPWPLYVWGFDSI